MGLCLQYRRREEAVNGGTDGGHAAGSAGNAGSSTMSTKHGVWWISSLFTAANQAPTPYLLRFGKSTITCRIHARSDFGRLPMELAINALGTI